MKKRSHLEEEFYAEGKVRDCPVYDLHGHMGQWYGIHFPRPDIPSMIESMDRAGVKMLVFCHHAALFAPDIGNSANIEAVRRFPKRLRAYCAINPNYPEIALRDVKTFERYQDIYVGFKFLADYHNYPVTSNNYQSALELVDEKELLVLLHTWEGSIYNGPEIIRKVARKYHRAKILLGHSCHRDWDNAIGLARDFPNVYLELCSVLNERGVLEKFVENLGSKRIVFGTDFPWFSYHYYIGAVIGADITDEDRRDIFYRNAGELLRENREETIEHEI